MSRLIEADALKKYILRSIPNWSEDREIALDCIANSPTIEERKKGHWTPAFNGEFKGGAYWFKCSECGIMVPEVRNGGWNFCPNCGADMRGDADADYTDNNSDL